MKIVTLQEAVSNVSSGDRVFLQGAAMTPNLLIDGLCQRHEELANVELISIHTDGQALYCQEPYCEAFHLSSCFVGGNVRKGVNHNNGDYIPIFLSEIHQLFRKAILPLDVAFIQVSTPDRHGYCSLGVSVDITIPAVETAKKVIALVNPQVPRTHGDGIIHIDNIHLGVEIDAPIHEVVVGEPTKIEAKIGKHVAALIEDGATLQMGIGNIPNAVLNNLTNHKRLGIHTEMFSDGVLPPIEKGIPPSA
jgi:acyl-CoA hydrolase